MLRTKTVIIDRGTVEFGRPWNVVLAYYRQRDLIEVCFEMFALQQFFFCKF